MRFCTKCGAQNEEDAVFCTACGDGAEAKGTESCGSETKPNRRCLQQDGGISLRKRPFPLGRFHCCGLQQWLCFLPSVFWVATAKECDRCGKTYHGSGYYDSLDTNTVMCEDCAREYYAPFDYKAFRK